MWLFHLSQLLSHLILLSKVLVLIFWAGLMVFCGVVGNLAIMIWSYWPFFKCSRNFSVKLITMDIFWELLKGCLFVFSWLWIWFDWLDPYLPNNKQVRKQSLNSKFTYLFYSIKVCVKNTHWWVSRIMQKNVYFNIINPSKCNIID